MTSVHGVRVSGTGSYLRQDFGRDTLHFVFFAAHNASVGCSRKHKCVDQPDLCLNPKGSAPKRKGFSKL